MFSRISGVIGLAVVGLIAAVAIFTYSGLSQETAVKSSDASTCSSCDARKKDLSRLREALRKPLTETD